MTSEHEEIAVKFATRLIAALLGGFVSFVIVGLASMCVHYILSKQDQGLVRSLACGGAVLGSLLSGAH